MKPTQLFPLALALAFAPAAHAQSRIFVKAGATGSHTGSSWATAYDDLQMAINGASAGDSIFIAKGNYYPSVIAGTGTNPRDRTFLLRDQVSLYGGFAGTEAKLSDRDVAAIPSNASVLSGNLGAPDSSDNAYHVVTAINISAKTQLNGLFISGGNANGTSSNTVGSAAILRNYGGGLYNEKSSELIVHSRITANYSSEGGAGVYNDKSNISVKNSAFSFNVIYGSDPGKSGGGGMLNSSSDVQMDSCSFNNNKALSAQGGGALRNEGSVARFNAVNFYNNAAENGDGGGAIYNAALSHATYSNLTIENNTTKNQAGGMYNDNSKPTLTNVIFFTNSAESATGAMENDGGSDAILNNVVFFRNSTPGDGGAMQNWKSSPVLTDVTFKSNTAGGDGGGIYNYNTCSPKLNRCEFISNTADGNGGGFYNKRASHPLITNTVFAFNQAGNDGGGVYNVANNSTGSEPSSPIFTNVSIANNTAVNTGGGGFDDGWGASKLRNSIIAGNHASVIEDVDAPPAMVATALFRTIITDQYFLTGVSAPGTISGDIFLDTLSGDFRLAVASAAINKGDSNYFAVGATPDISVAGAFDYRHADRIMGDNIDLGAYEVCNDSLKPAVSITAIPSPVVPIGSTVTFTATASGGGTTPVYAWKKNGTLIAGATAATYVAVAGTNFVAGDVISAFLTSSLICVTTDTASSNSFKMGYLTGIANAAGTLKNISLFPNPNQGRFTLEADFEAGAAYEFAVKDLTGRTVYHHSFTAQSKQNNKEMELNAVLNAGVYFLSINKENEPKQIIRFVVQ